MIIGAVRAKPLLQAFQPRHPLPQGVASAALHGGSLTTQRRLSLLTGSIRQVELPGIQISECMFQPSARQITAIARGSQHFRVLIQALLERGQPQPLFIATLLGVLADTVQRFGDARPDDAPLKSTTLRRIRPHGGTLGVKDAHRRTMILLGQSALGESFIELAQSPVTFLHEFSPDIPEACLVHLSRLFAHLYTLGHHMRCERETLPVAALLDNLGIGQRLLGTTCQLGDDQFGLVSVKSPVFYVAFLHGHPNLGGLPESTVTSVVQSHLGSR